MMEPLRRLRIVEKRRETPDAATFVLEPADGNAPLIYEPGQYLSLAVSPHGKDLRRAYSFSSSPHTDKLPAITVRRVVNGEVSNWLLDHCEQGQHLLSAGVAGQFLLPSPLPPTLVYLAAGSGITPVISHLKTLFAAENGPKVLLAYANSDSRHSIFKSQIDRWIEQYPERFHCRYFMSREKGVQNAYFGHLHKTAWEDWLTENFGARPSRIQHRNTVIFLCTPFPLMRMARMSLRVLDFPARNIRQEIFRPERTPPARIPDPSRTHIIQVRRGDERIEFSTFEGETILNAALRQGIDLPYTCKAGVCLSCLAQCREGAVDLVFAENTRHEGAGSMINTCIGYAASERVVLDFE
ncbi:MAG TPA: iron-sulfur cluster-binding domain-containing protein [Saprospiraceae bacterium]|nr:iron-sulfur cluster-binding domain-containing protein [Saprospiraceae bacterium]